VVETFNLSAHPFPSLVSLRFQALLAAVTFGAIAKLTTRAFPAVGVTLPADALPLFPEAEFVPSTGDVFSIPEYSEAYKSKKLQVPLIVTVIVVETPETFVA
jgi:hypothetical protein